MYAKLVIVLLGMAVGALAAGSNCSCSQLQGCVEARFKAVETCRSTCESDLPSGVAACEAEKKAAFANIVPSSSDKATIESCFFKAGNGICETPEISVGTEETAHTWHPKNTTHKHNGNHTGWENHPHAAGNHTHNKTNPFEKFHSCMRTCLNETHNETGEYEATEKSHEGGHPGAEGHHEHHHEKKRRHGMALRHCAKSLKCEIDRKGEEQAHGNCPMPKPDASTLATLKAAAEKTCVCFHNALNPTGNATAACSGHHGKKGDEENGGKHKN